MSPRAKPAPTPRSISNAPSSDTPSEAAPNAPTSARASPRRGAVGSGVGAAFASGTSTAATRRSRSFQITPSSMKWCRLTSAAISMPSPASNGSRPSTPGANKSAGKVHAAEPTESARA